jgi:hypothetical protein
MDSLRRGPKILVLELGSYLPLLVLKAADTNYVRRAALTAVTADREQLLPAADNQREDENMVRVNFDRGAGTSTALPDISVLVYGELCCCTDTLREGGKQRIHEIVKRPNAGNTKEQYCH